MKRSPLFEFDYEFSKLLGVDLGNQVPSWVVLGLEHGGSGVIWFPLAIILSALETGMRTWALNLLVALVLDIAVVGILKALVQRKRPDFGNLDGYVLVADVDKYSFPSGHASRAVMVAAVSVACLKAMSKPAHKLTVWTWAVLTCFARVLHRRHYVSDVACGMLIGVAVAGVTTGWTWGSTGLLIPESYVAGLPSIL